MPSNYGAGGDSWESLGVQGDQTSSSSRKSTLNIHWKDWCWNWSSNTLATWCKELTDWKRPWCWERLKAGWEGDDGGWDGWMASPAQWTWIWASSRRWWRTGKPGMLQSVGSQKFRQDLVTERQPQREKSSAWMYIVCRLLVLSYFLARCIKISSIDWLELKNRRIIYFLAPLYQSLWRTHRNCNNCF